MTSAVKPSVPSGVRCSDRERERTSERLRAATGEGYVTMDELEERLSAVYAARYRHELDAVVADLPQPAARPATSGWRPVLDAAFRQFVADLALLFGRGATGWNRRRVVIAVCVALVVAGLVFATVHGFGGDGYGRHGFGPPAGGPRRHF